MASLAPYDNKLNHALTVEIKLEISTGQSTPHATQERNLPELASSDESAKRK